MTVDITTTNNKAGVFNAKEVDMIAKEIEEDMITTEEEYIFNAQELEAVAKETENERFVAEKRKKPQRRTKLKTTWQLFNLLKIYRVAKKILYLVMILIMSLIARYQKILISYLLARHTIKKSLMMT